MKILIIDRNHDILAETLAKAGFVLEEDYNSDKMALMEKIGVYDGLIIRSRIPLDQAFLEQAHRLKFIGRVGAGLENIDMKFAEKQNIKVYNASEGNRQAVAEHALGMLLSLMNNFQKSREEIKAGIWKREENRGDELFGKTVGIIGYGNNGSAFARLLKAFQCEVLCVDILPRKSDEFAKQVDLETLQKHADVISLHTPLTDETRGMLNHSFFEGCEKNIYLLNVARGECLVTEDLLQALKSGKVKGAGLDVLEYEKSSFEGLSVDEYPLALKELLAMDQVIFTPHVAGWTHESKEKLARVIAEKIITDFK